MNLNRKLGNGILSLIHFLGFGLIMLLSACGGQNATAPNGGKPSQITGIVIGAGGVPKTAASNGIQGASVVVTQLQTDGSLQVVSTDTVQTDVNGNFTVATNLDNQSNLIVVANTDSIAWLALVSAPVRRGTTVSCQPLTDESTLEAIVYTQIVTAGNGNLVTSADIHSAINSQLVANVKDNVTAATTIAAAITAGVDARNSLLLDASVGATQAQITAANSARQQAQIVLEASLLAAAVNQAALFAAQQAFYQAEINAFFAAGISAGSCAKAYEANSRALARQSTTLGGKARFALGQQTTSVEARAVARAVVTQFTGFGASSDRLLAVTNAGVALQAAIDSAATDQDIASAWQGFHDAVLSELRTAVNSQSAAILALDSSLNGGGGAKLVLKTSLTAASSTQLIVNAFSSFYTAVRTLAQTTLVGAGPSQIQFVSEILILINMTA
jgi:aryl carrier-like protein